MIHIKRLNEMNSGEYKLGGVVNDIPRTSYIEDATLQINNGELLLYVIKCEENDTSAIATCKLKNNPREYTIEIPREKIDALLDGEMIESLLDGDDVYISIVGASRNGQITKHLKDRKYNKTTRYNDVPIGHRYNENVRRKTRRLMNESWDMAIDMGYEPKTTFWDDFTIADKFGVNAVKDTYRRAFAGWKNDYIYLTELVLVLNHKIWQHHEKNQALAKLYNDLWEKTDEYALDHLKGDELKYFISTTD